MFPLQRNVQRIIIFANGELPDLNKARLLLREDDYFICADGGTRHALALGVQPDLLVLLPAGTAAQDEARRETGDEHQLSAHDGGS